MTDRAPVLERPQRPLPTLAEMGQGFGRHPFVNGLVSFIFAMTVPIALVLAVGKEAGLTDRELETWLFAAYFIPGFFTVAFSILYRQPVGMAWTMPGTVLVAPALANATFEEVMGAFVVAGILLLIIGLSGLVRRAMEALPAPVVLGMVAGVFLKFALDMIAAFETGLVVALPMALAWLVLSAVPMLGRFLPPLIGALIAGIVAIWIAGAFQMPANAELALHWPEMRMPAFKLTSMAELVVPLAVTVLAAQNSQGFAVLAAAGHKPPMNAATAACGIGSILMAPFGAVSMCVTGPTNAIMVSSGARAHHYLAGVLFGGIFIVFGLVASGMTQLVLAAPITLVVVMAGLGMLRVLQSSFALAFKSGCTLGALVAFLVAASNVTILTIGAPFWALVFGYAIARLMERKSFDTETAGSVQSEET